MPLKLDTNTGASNTGVSTSATVLVAPVLETMVLVAGSTGATTNYVFPKEQTRLKSDAFGAIEINSILALFSIQ